MTYSLHRPVTLIVDDESDICFLLGNILKHKNITPVFASSLSEADDIIANGGSFSFVFLDNYLPDGAGISYISRIRNKCPRCKIIIITAHDNASDREKAAVEGADYFIGKPFSKETILSTIDRLSQ